MNFQPGQQIKIYSNEHGYFTRLATKDINSEWSNAFVYVKFRKGTIIPNKSTIEINDSWLSFYENKKNNKVVLYIFINDFTMVLDN